MLISSILSFFVIFLESFIYHLDHMPITLHFNYSDKSLPAKLADSMATPLRWASGKGKIHIHANSIRKDRLSEANLARAAYRTIGVVLVIFGTITIVPLLTTLLFKAALARWDKSAQKACNIYAQFKEAQKPSNTDPETLGPPSKPENLQHKDEDASVPTPEPIQHTVAEEQETVPEPETNVPVGSLKTVEDGGGETSAIEPPKNFSINYHLDEKDPEFRKDLSTTEELHHKLSSTTNKCLHHYRNTTPTKNLLAEPSEFGKGFIEQAERSNYYYASNPSPSNLGELPAGVYSTIGFRRRTQEDTHILEEISFYWKGQEVPIKLASVFDGHGGSECSRFLRKDFNTTFLAVLNQKLISLQTDTQDPWDSDLRDIAIRNALKHTFVILHNDFKKTGFESGSTACVNLIIDNKIYTANTGDSRAVYRSGREAEIQQLSWDHKPQACEKGVKSRGEEIENGRVNGLAVARAIGDYHIAGITPRPSIMIVEAPPSAGHLIIASDGLWDVCTSSQAFELLDLFLQEGPDLSCYELAKKMAYRALAAFSADNISIIIVRV